MVSYSIILPFVILRSETALGELYGTSILEHHHFNQAVAILNSEVTIKILVFASLLYTHCQ